MRKADKIESSYRDFSSVLFLERQRESVCVCVRDRERERKESGFLALSLVSLVVCLCVLGRVDVGRLLLLLRSG